MAGFSCYPLFLYPSIILILIFSSTNYNHPFNFFSSLSSLFPHNPIIFHTDSNNGTTPTRIDNVGDLDLDHDHKCDFEKMEEGLARARAAIREAARSRTYLSLNTKEEEGFVPRGSIYKNPFAFYQSHKEMEKRFKVWTYKEGEEPLFHKGPVNDIYAIEGQLMDELESGNSPFLANHPDQALAFFLPVSIVNVIRFVYRPYVDFSRIRLQNIVKDYIALVSHKYPYWNRTGGADHFLVSCHDWAPDVSVADPHLFKDFIRVLCNANKSEGFQPARDVSLPEFNLLFGSLGSQNPGQPPNNRSIIAFFAGSEHGYIREVLFHYWKDKDKDIVVQDTHTKNQNYTTYSQLMSQSKFCLCPSGFEVASPRVVESINIGCVPVIISDNYALPFSDVLDWSQFSVQIPSDKIPEIKKILLGISKEEYLRKQKNVILVQPHFALHRPSKPYDVMHMVMHSLWLRRLNLKILR